MELRFYGATGDTTGSCHMLSANGAHVLLDCGLYQGRREEAYRRNREFAFAAGRVDAVVQSHAHVDHSGKLPMLVREGFRGRVYATHGTRDLCEILLVDSAHIQVKDAETLNRRRSYENERRERRVPIDVSDPDEPACLAHAQLPEREVQPLYFEADVRKAMRLFDQRRYGDWFDVATGIRCRFHDAGHILGSAWIEAEVTEGQRTNRLIFTGDYGRAGQPVLRDPEPLCDADVIISESTYGDRSHPDFENTEQLLGDAVERLARRGRGRLLVPVFAVGRAQNLLYTLAKIFRARAVGEVCVVVDSPLAKAATEVVASHPEYFDEETLSEFARLKAGSLLGKRLSFTSSVDESKALNRDPRPLVIMAGSGMLENGRIVHHLAWNVSRDDCEVLIVGYQARNTLGRKLLDGASEVNMLGRRFAVRTKVTALLGFSAHADREGLLAALTPHANKAKALFLVHGENDQRAPLARTLSERGFVRVESPEDSRPFTF